MSSSARKRAACTAVKTVSECLGNTPTVCRRSYIDPRIIDRFDDGETVAPVLRRLGAAPDMNDCEVREAIESAVTDHVVDEHEHTATVPA